MENVKEQYYPEGGELSKKLSEFDYIALEFPRWGDGYSFKIRDNSYQKKVQDKIKEVLPNNKIIRGNSLVGSDGRTELTTYGSSNANGKLYTLLIEVKSGEDLRKMYDALLTPSQGFYDYLIPQFLKQARQLTTVVGVSGRDRKIMLDYDDPSTTYDEYLNHQREKGKLADGGKTK